MKSSILNIAVGAALILSAGSAAAHEWQLSGHQPWPQWTNYDMETTTDADGTVTARLHLDVLYSSFEVNTKDWKYEYSYVDEQGESKTLPGYGKYEFTLAAGKAPIGIIANDPAGVARQMGLGWNLGDQFDAFVRPDGGDATASETGFGRPEVTPELIKEVAATGVKTIRIPVTWLGRFGSAPDFKIDEAYFARLEQVIGYAEDAGLNVIINVHHDGAGDLPNSWLPLAKAVADPAVHQATIEQIKTFWTQIARRFADKGPWLIFEGFNEIHNGNWGWYHDGDEAMAAAEYRVLNEWNQAFVDAVRATGGYNAGRYLGVPGIAAMPATAVKGLEVPRDPAGRIMVSVHFYEPQSFSLSNEYSEWGHTGTDTQPGFNEDHVVRTFDALREKFIDKGVPVYFGEMGCTNRDTERGRKLRFYYLEYVVKAAADRGIPCVIWDNGLKATGREALAIFDRENGGFYADGEEAMALMLKAATCTDPEYTLESVYNSAPQ